MKYSLLLFLFLPLPSFAQFGRTYTGPTMQQNQQSRQQFNQMTNQRTQDFQQRQLQKNRGGYGGQSMTREAQLQAQAKREQEANEKLAQLAQEQQRKRQQHPAANPQQAALQQKKDDKQLTLLAVKNYREVFLPGQVSNALDARQLSPKAQQQLGNLNEHLTDKAWWKKQEGAQLPGTIKAYGDTLNALAAGLLGFDVASPPAMPAPLSVSGLNAQLATDVFDQNAVTQLVGEAALSEKLLAGEQLIKAVTEFSRLSAAAASPEPQRDPAKWKEQVQDGLRQVNKAMSRYNVRMSELTIVYEAQKALLKSTGAYVAKNGK
ncbi:hypothetical protein [Hymenobacter edaphi]|uniref:Uncharacterized protein n=1 Tax=Hymenobacter edaphi TaxID=2211146 RepID=A0A328B5A8_9BACT|nr:hypothetical protein [Hymenobacter edaphi]RAK62067.1 hypothetical protein DLM85_24515 [Hymenobacter edaphi]